MLKSVMVSAFALIILPLSGCKPTEPPIKIGKTQRDVLDKAKAVEGQLQQAQDRTRAAEEGQK